MAVDFSKYLVVFVCYLLNCYLLIRTKIYRRDFVRFDCFCVLSTTMHRIDLSQWTLLGYSVLLHSVFGVMYHNERCVLTCTFVFRMVAYSEKISPEIWR